jgi:hypothetical protein
VPGAERPGLSVRDVRADGAVTFAARGFGKFRSPSLISSVPQRGAFTAGATAAQSQLSVGSESALPQRAHVPLTTHPICVVRKKIGPLDQRAGFRTPHQSGQRADIVDK